MRDQKNTQPFSEFGTYFLSEYAGTTLLMYGRVRDWYNWY